MENNSFETSEVANERSKVTEDVLESSATRVAVLHESVNQMIRCDYLRLRDSDNVEDRIQATLLVLHRQTTCLDLFPKLFTDPDPRVRSALVRNAFFSSRFFPAEFEHLYQDPDPLVRVAVVESSFMTLYKRPALLRLFLRNPHPDVLLALIKSRVLWLSRFEQITVEFLEQNRHRTDLLQLFEGNRHYEDFLFWRQHKAARAESLRNPEPQG